MGRRWGHIGKEEGALVSRGQAQDQNVIRGHGKDQIKGYIVSKVRGKARKRAKAMSRVIEITVW